MLIFKIVHRLDWEAAERVGMYAGSDKDRADGFLHFSKSEQLAETLERHYADADDLLLLAVEAAELGSALRWETSRNGELFPHLYSNLPQMLVKQATPIVRGDDGKFTLPL